MMLYATQENLEGLNAYSLGNLGGSDVFCIQAPIAFTGTTVQLSCPAGTKVDLDALSDSSGELVYSAGIINADDAKRADYCAESAMTEVESCSSFLNKEKLYSDL